MSGKLHRKFQFRGLDTRTNKLLRQEGTASDCRNVFLNSNRDLVKRPDFSALSVPRAASGTQAVTQPLGDFFNILPPDAEIIDFIKYKDHFLLITRNFLDLGGGNFYYPNKFYKYFEETNTVELIATGELTKYFTNIGRHVLNPLGTVGGRVTSVIQNGVLYFMGELGEQSEGLIVSSNPGDAAAKENSLCYMFSYDGLMVQKAGVVQTINDTTTDTGTSATNDYVRIIPFKFDNEGAIHYGNYSTHKAVLNAGNQELDIAPGQITISGLAPLLDYQCHARFTGGSGIIFGPSATIDVDIARFLTGDSVMIGQYLNWAYTQDLGGSLVTTSIFRARIENLTTGDPNSGDNATLTIGDFKLLNETNQEFEDTSSIFIDNGTFLTNYFFAVYGSEDFTAGFTYKGITTWAVNIDDDASPSTGFSFSYRDSLPPIEAPFLGIPQEFEDGIDDTTVKLPPPRGYQVIDYLGALLVVDNKNLYFSDISVGGTVESFTPFDNFPVGSDKRGRITGVFANETFITVFREEEAYYVTGNIFTANYRIQSYQSTRIGCSDPRSIIDFRGAGMFLSPRGFYMCQQGGAMPEISDAIETVFTDGELNLDLDLSQCAALVDFNREYICFHIKTNDASSGYIFAYSYYHNEWFIWEDVNANGGFRSISSTLYHSDGVDIYKENGANVDSTAFYRSNFETLGVPSFGKRFHQALLYTMDMPASARITLKTYRDWITSKVDTKESKRVKTGQSDMTQRFDPARSKSLAIQIESASGQALRIAGYEYEYDDDIRMFKNDD